MLTGIVIGAYLIGSVPFALILARRWGTADLREVGSGNVGASNVLRVLGVRPGVLVAFLDASKGAASVALAAWFGGGGTAPAVAGVAAVVGHVYPVWLRFRGGKGVATACGAFGVLAPMAAVPAFGIFMISVCATRYVSLGSVLASAALPPIAWALGGSPATVTAASAASVLIVFRHRSNLRRLFRGSERRLGARG